MSFLMLDRDVLSQSIWLNSHIKNTSPCLKNWIENDIYIINDLLDQNKQEKFKGSVYFFIHVIFNA
jgi:hypothetical protein